MDTKHSVLAWVFDAEDLQNLKELLPINIQTVFNNAVDGMGEDASSSSAVVAACKKAAAHVTETLSTKDHSIMVPFNVTVVDIVSGGGGGGGGGGKNSIYHCYCYHCIVTIVIIVY